MADRDVQDPQALGRAQGLGHEFRDVNALLIMASGLGLLLLIGLALVTVYGLAVVWAGGAMVPSSADSDAMPPLARQDFQANQHLIRMAMERQQRERLGSYGWVDRAAGTARIPIERAIHILAERGSLKAAGAAAEPTAPGKDAPLERARNPRSSAEKSSGQKTSTEKTPGQEARG
ncbi:MAG: hypothetical protein AB7F89_00585 [Pirellulaceae bacterium]